MIADPGLLVIAGKENTFAAFRGCGVVLDLHSPLGESPLSAAELCKVLDVLLRSAE